MAALVGGVIWVERLLREAMPGDPHVGTYFSWMYLTLALGGVISAGSFLGRSVVEVENLRIASVLPGLWRRLGGDVLWTAPVAGAVAVGFLHWTTAEQFRGIAGGTLWCVSLFLFCVGFGLGWSWITVSVLVALVTRLSSVIGFIERSPVFAGVLALLGAGGVLALRTWRFCPREGSAAQRCTAWLKGPFESRAETRRTVTERLADRSHTLMPGVTRATSPLRAGVLERFGASRTALAQKTLLSLGAIYVGFGLFVIGAMKNARGGTPEDFIARVFATPPIGQQTIILHVLFAALSGCVGFVATFALDLSLQPHLWHPLSRNVRAHARFLSHLVQNVGWAALQAIAALGLCLGAARWSGSSLSVEALAAYVMPSAVGFMLAPLLQALFPQGMETFRGKTSSLVQLGAGLTGAAYCLAIAYWSTHWPSADGERSLGLHARVGAWIGAVVAVYALYFFYLHSRYDRADLSRRAL